MEVSSKNAVVKLTLCKDYQTSDTVNCDDPLLTLPGKAQEEAD